MRWYHLTLIILILGLQSAVWLGDTGLANVLKLTSQIEILTLENQQTLRQLETLIDETEAIKKHPEGLEKLAREHLGMVHEEDTWYWLIPENSMDATSNKTLK